LFFRSSHDRGHGRDLSAGARNKSLLLLFFRKEVLSYVRPLNNHRRRHSLGRADRVVEGHGAPIDIGEGRIDVEVALAATDEVRVITPRSPLGPG
jgi:hypothetical protein